MVLSKAMRFPDVDRERSERLISFFDFMKSYNQGLPATFPRASRALLAEFKKNNEALFKNGDLWSLDQHRKKVMDWLISRRSIS